MATYPSNEYYKNQNQMIFGRYQEAAKQRDIAEIYAAKAQYADNIAKQQRGAYRMAPSSAEYANAKADIKTQQQTCDGMFYTAGEREDAVYKMEDILNKKSVENEALFYEMRDAAEKGDQKKFDELSARYEKNMDVQRGICMGLKDKCNSNDMAMQDKISQKEADVNRQELESRDCKYTMYNHYSDKVAQSKYPSAQDKQAFEKYKSQHDEYQDKIVERQTEQRLKSLEKSGFDKDYIREESRRCDYNNEHTFFTGEKSEHNRNNSRSR